MTHAAVCACGRKLESDDHTRTPMLLMADLRTATHDPDECSRNIGYEERCRGRREMVEATMRHLLIRRSLSAAELAETRTELLGYVMHMPEHTW